MNFKKFSNFVDLLSYRSQNQPNQIAYTFLQDGDREAGKLTYRELDRQARAIGTYIRRYCRPGERVLLLYPQGLEVISAFLGCLYAGVIAIPVPPPDRIRLKRTFPRLQAVIQDADVSIALTTDQIKSSIENLQSEISDLVNLHWIATEQINLELAQEWEKPNIEPDSLAYLQYTSGSTSLPKGVMISHSNLMHNSACINQAFKYTPDSIAATWLPYFHDFGLVDGFIQPLYAGIPSFIMSPLAFIKRPIKWLRAISRYRVTHSSSPNFGYDYCVRRISLEQCSDLDLSSWRTASVGAEPVRKETLESFVKLFSQYGFQQTTFSPGYGLAEATLLVSLKTDRPAYYTVLPSALEKNVVVQTINSQGKYRTVTNCGAIIPDTKVIIVHPEKLTQCDADEVGEIWVSGSSVALGYWNNFAATESTFKAYLFNTTIGPFLRTGDLGFIKDGELFVTSRLKDLIIIGGANHYPQDIELTAEKSHPIIKPNCSAAFSLPPSGDLWSEERLVIIAEVEHHHQGEQYQIRSVEHDDSKDNLQPVVDIKAVVQAIREAISQDYELMVYAVVLIKSGSIPKTSSGKIQRSACRKAFLEDKLDIVFQG